MAFTSSRSGAVLPGGKVEMQVVGKRYEKIGVDLSSEKFLIGATIVRLESESNAVYDHFLRKGSRSQNPPKGSLELGID